MTATPEPPAPDSAASPEVTPEQPAAQAGTKARTRARATSTKTAPAKAAPAKAEPVAAEAEPVATEAQPVATGAEAESVGAESVESEPVEVELTPVDAEDEPVVERELVSVASVATPAPAGPSIGTASGFRFGHLVRAEYLKLRTTNVWWLLLLFTTLTTGLALTVNILTFHFGANGHTTDGEPYNQVNGAAAIFTSGQFFGALFAVLLAILTITNEYHHQTVTTTFLAVPRRTSVIWAKFVVSMIAAALFWVFTTVLDLITGAIYFSSDGFSSHLGDHKVIEAMLLSLMVFALWSVFGVGLGVLIRSQIGATVTAAMLYTVGLYLAIGIFGLIHAYLIKSDWSLTAMVIVPAVAAQIAISPTKIFPASPAQWVGIVVMVGYAVVFGAIGLYYTKRRDVS